MVHILLPSEDNTHPHITIYLRYSTCLHIAIYRRHNSSTHCYLPKIALIHTLLSTEDDQCSRENCVLEIPLDKELTANCLVETRMKLEELILAVMVDYGLNRVQHSLRLQKSLIK